MMSAGCISLRSAAVALLCAAVGMLDTAEARFTATTTHKERSFSARYTDRQKASGRRKIRKTRCAKHRGFCRGHYAHSRYPCCQDPDDECKRISKQFSVCVPKPKERKEDGEPCEADGDCKNACLSSACEDTDDLECEGPPVCGSLPTVDYEEPPCVGLYENCDDGGECCDADNNAKAECLADKSGESTCKPTVPCDVDGEPCTDDTSCCGLCEADPQCERKRGEGDPPCPRVCEARPIAQLKAFAKCPGKTKHWDQICWKRHGKKHNCKGRLRCSWGTKWHSNKGWRSVGVCKWPPNKPIFNC